MQLTSEQIAIINSNQNIKINAVAGSGKTTTVIEYARTRPVDARILYLAFNRSVRLEAAARFAACGLKNVVTETAHSLAFKQIVPRNRYKVRPAGYKTSEIAELLSIRGGGEKHATQILASHVLRMLSLYCNSDRTSIQEIDYLSTLTDPRSRGLATSFRSYIEKKTALLFKKMDSREIDITHDFYLKKFQLSSPRLDFDYILFDEGQDASGAMLDVFLNQDATKVIVGDTNQQIYGWRFAVNSLEKTDFISFDLSTSFRFGSGIAALAQRVLEYKGVLGRAEPFIIKGTGSSQAIRSRAIIARTNVGLLSQAIEYINGEKPAQHIFFEGNIHSYMYADEGASLYDILNLHNGRFHLIRDKIIRQMKTLKELEEYAKATEDPQLGMMADIVKKYGKEIPRIMRILKEKHVSNEERDKAGMIFSTVHRSKGMEYDEVFLANDFLKEKAVEKFKEGDRERYTPEKLNEEINLLYVAVTRAKVKLHIPEAMVPKGFEPAENIVVLRTPEQNNRSTPKPEAISTTSYKRAFRAYSFWDNSADQELLLLLHEGLPTREIATHFGKSERSIEARMNRLVRAGKIK